MQGQSEFNRTLAANFSKELQLNYRRELDTIRYLFNEDNEAILAKVKQGKIVDGKVEPYSLEEIDKMKRDAFNSIKSMLFGLKSEGGIPEELLNTGGGSLVRGKDGVYRIGN